MSKNVKVLLWVLGSAAVLNVAADIWFRLAVSTSTKAPWYVWAPVVGTVVVELLTLLGQVVFKKMQQRTAPAEEAQPIAKFVTVEYLVDGDNVDLRAAAAVHALLALRDKTGRAWTAMHTNEVLQQDGRWRFEMSCRPT